MLSKLLITVMTTVLLVVVCFPVQAHNGRISNLLIDPPGIDEQPWGGESQYTGNDLPQLSAPDPGIYQGKYFFIRLTLDYGWFTITEYVLDIFSGNETKTVTGPAVPINDTSTETQNGDTGAGIN